MLLRTGCYRGTTPRPGATRCRPNHLAIGIRDAGLDSTRFHRSAQLTEKEIHVWDRMTIRFLEDREGKRLFDEEGSLWLASLDRQWRESKSGEKERDTTTLEMWNKAGPLTQIPVSRDRFPVDEPSTLDVSVRLRVDTRPRSFDQSGMIDRYRPFPRLGNNRFTRPILFVPWSPQRVPRLQHCCKCGQRGSWEMCIVFVTRERISIATRGQVWIIDRRFCW